MQANEGNTTPRMASSDDGMRVPPWLSLEAVDRLVSTMEVQVIALSECVVGPGFAIDLDGCDTPSFHYLREGYGRLYMRNGIPAAIEPQALIIVPPHCPFRFEPAPSPSSAPAESTAFMLCGTFRSLCGHSIDLFDTLHAPVVEQFSRDDGLEPTLQLALTEHIAREVCSDVLVSSAMKQVLIALIRRSVLSKKGWTRRFVVVPVAEHASLRVSINSRKA
jgi:AraC family transcriptional activator of mtrCDE